MSLRVETSKIEPDIVVLLLSGSMTMGPETDALESLVRDRVKGGDKKLVFELSGVERIDSIGGMMLLRCFISAREAGGALRIVGASESVTRLFKSTHIDTLIHFYPNLAAACEDFTIGRHGTPK